MLLPGLADSFYLVGTSVADIGVRICYDLSWQTSTNEDDWLYKYVNSLGLADSLCLVGIM